MKKIANLTLLALSACPYANVDITNPIHRRAFESNIAQMSKEKQFQNIDSPQYTHAIRASVCELAIHNTGDESYVEHERSLESLSPHMEKLIKDISTTATVIYGSHGALIYCSGEESEKIQVALMDQESFSDEFKAGIDAYSAFSESNSVIGKEIYIRPQVDEIEPESRPYVGCVTPAQAKEIYRVAQRGSEYTP